MNMPVKRVVLKTPSVTPLQRREKLYNQLMGAIVSPLAWVAAHVYQTPGLDFHRRCAQLAVQLLFRANAPIQPGWLHLFLFAPMSTTRYMEFDFAWRKLANVKAKTYLDVSSPRLFPTLLLRHNRELLAELLNPDEKDLAITRMLIEACGLQARCHLGPQLIEEAQFQADFFDIITSISVVEHIPNDTNAITKLWTLLKTGGKLLLTLPCAAEAHDIYIDSPVYGLVAADGEGLNFVETVYDETRLSERIFCITGKPADIEIWGEKKPGFLRNHLFGEGGTNWQMNKMWNESFVMGKEFARYQRFSDLPGEGVVCLEFVKGN